MVGFDLTWVLSGLLLIPYLLWGIYLLRQRLAYKIELDRAVETFTFVFLILFFFFELSLMRAWLQDSPIKLVFATLALTVSLFALYGPLLMSLGSHLLIDLVMPTGKFNPSVPRYGAAEGFEMRGDYEGAAREFIAIARTFPKEYKAALRAADNLMKIDKPAVAAPWFESALELVNDQDEALKIVNRLVQIYRHDLKQSDEGREVLEEYLQRFPTSEYAESVRNRLARLEVEDAESSPDLDAVPAPPGYPLTPQ